MPEESKDWKRFAGEQIPSSLELFPIFYEYFKKDFKILDLGCGFGKTCLQLYSEGYHNIHGIDANESGIEFARKKAKEMFPNEEFPKFEAGDAIKLPFGEHSFDGVIIQALLTAITRQNHREKVFSEIKRILRPGGYVYIADFGQTWEHPTYKKRYEDGLKKGYERGTFEARNPETGELEYLAHHYTKEEFEHLLKSTNFKIKYYSSETVTTRTGNKVNGHVIVAQR